MIPRTPETHPLPPASPLSSDRRVYVRHSRNLEMLWQCLGMAAPERAAAAVFDLSHTGVGLMMDEPIATGSRLILRLPTAMQGWGTHLVRVKRCEPQDDGTYQVGCAFVKPLTARQLQALLG